MPAQPTPDDVVQCRRCRAIGRSEDILLQALAEPPPVVRPFPSAPAWEAARKEGDHAAAGG